MPNPLNSIDIRILNELQKDGKITNVELASRVGLSPSPCLARVKAMERSGLIRGYVALLDPGAIGPTIDVFIQVTLERQTEAALEAFEKSVLELPEVMECFLMSGDSDYMLRVLVRDTHALKDFILEKLSTTKGVATIRSSFALNKIKYKTAIPVAQLLGQ